MPACVTEAMNLHLLEIAKAIAPGLTPRSWSTRLAGTCRPASLCPITIIPLPSKCPELNPLENIWQFMRDNWLSNRVFKSYDDLVDHSTTSPGASCLSDCANGLTSSDQRDLV
jgi:DDE superfamily endonuclease